MGIFRKGLLDVFILALLWGPSFLFMKVAISDIAPFTLIGLRVGLASLFLYAILKIKSISVKIDRSLLLHACVVGFFANGLPFVCFCYSLFYIPTSLSALLNGTTPILTILLAAVLFDQESLTWNKAIGVLLGLLGFFVLFAPSLFGSEAAFDPKGISLGFIGAASYAVGMVYAKKYIQGRANPLVILMFQLLSSFVILSMLATVFEAPHTLFSITSSKTWYAVFALAFFGTALAFILYYRVLISQGVGMLSMVTYLLPVVATVLGVLFLEEEVGSSFLLATFFILSGILLVNRKVKLPIVMEEEASV